MSWMLLPTKKATKSRVGDDGRASSTTDLLTKAGYICQSSAGIYTLMPLGHRVVQKIEGIIDEEMQRVGGQKLAMPSLLTPDNWKRTGRWQSTGDELFSFKDRKNAMLLLGPTHEEEITAIVKDMVRSYRQYPLRLYQTTRKFRDEARPRAGLLRGREFIMKDMYTFDVTRQQAIKTFHAIEAAYRRCFDRVGVPYAVADADSGNIGGSMSKEFHFVNQSGEDTLLRCQRCGYTANEERALSRCASGAEPNNGALYLATVVEGSDPGIVVKQRMVEVPSSHEPSTLKIKQMWSTKPTQRLELAVVSDECHGDVACTEPAMEARLFDNCVAGVRSGRDKEGEHGEVVCGDWHVAKEGDQCTECNGTLEAHRAIEVGHIFFLGDKYSRALDLSVLHQGQRDYVQMGCFGIGVSRVLQAAAECSSANGRGLRWPPSIAPYLVSIVPLGENGTRAVDVYKLLDAIEVRGEPVLRGNVMVDDRDYLSAGFRLHDAQLLGIPLTVVLGSRFAELGQVEVQLRMPGTQLLRENIALMASDVTCDEFECKAHVDVSRLGALLTLVLESCQMVPGQAEV